MLSFKQEDETASEELQLPEIIEAIHNGLITEETLIWTEGMENWETFEDGKHRFAWPSDDEDDEEN